MHIVRKFGTVSDQGEKGSAYPALRLGENLDAQCAKGPTMKVFERIMRECRGRTKACTLVLAGAMTFPAFSLAEEFPPLRPGLWEFVRSMNDSTGSHRQTTFTQQKCADPTADMKKMHAKLSKQGCALSPLSRNEDTYASTAVCTVFGVQMESRTLLTVKGDSDYSVVVTSIGTAGSVTEEISAARLGDCRK
jgi:hypothetical protein